MVQDIFRASEYLMGAWDMGGLCCPIFSVFADLTFGSSSRLLYQRGECWGS